MNRNQVLTSDKDFTVLIPTYNRASVLATTLTSMCNTNREKYKVEFVVIDNNSTDETRSVVDSFLDKIPLTYLFQPRKGKSAAMNLALEKVPLAKIVVFTDDDILCEGNWFESMAEAVKKWPGHSVFGGKVELVWPDTELPYWTRLKSIQPWAFGEHDLGSEARLYQANCFPGGAHYWVRRDAITSSGIRFDETIGPEEGRPMGDETTFLRTLVESTGAAVYWPRAVVRHQVNIGMLNVSTVRKRAYRWGRGMPHGELCHRDLFDRSPVLWRLIRLCSLIRHFLLYAVEFLWPIPAARMEKVLNRITRIGYDVESLRCSLKK